MNAPVTIERPRANVPAMLAIKRGSILNVGGTAAAHLELALCALEIADDVGFSHHFVLARNHFVAAAKLATDLRATREVAGL
jgi:hypothetical protein